MRTAEARGPGVDPVAEGGGVVGDRDGDRGDGARHDGEGQEPRPGEIDKRIPAAPSAKECGAPYPAGLAAACPVDMTSISATYSGPRIGGVVAW